jgi:hypothetical protein
MPVITRELENVEAGVSVSIEGLLDGVDYKGLREQLPAGGQDGRGGQGKNYRKV